MSRDFYQYAYVTTDFDRAMEEIQRTYGVGEFMVANELAVPNGRGSETRSHYAFAFKGALQFEIIRPLFDEEGFYTSYLPDEGYTLKFHHLGRHFASPEEYHRTLGAARARWPIPIDAETMGTVYSYADARADLSHYLEFFCFPENSPFENVPRY